MEHKLIQGGEQYLPFARSRIKALRATGLKYARQTFDLGDARVEVRYALDQEYITIHGGGWVAWPCFVDVTGTSAVLDVPIVRLQSYMAYPPPVAAPPPPEAPTASDLKTLPPYSPNTAVPDNLYPVFQMTAKYYGPRNGHEQPKELTAYFSSNESRGEWTARLGLKESTFFFGYTTDDPLSMNERVAANNRIYQEWLAGYNLAYDIAVAEARAFNKPIIDAWLHDYGVWYQEYGDPDTEPQLATEWAPYDAALDQMRDQQIEVLRGEFARGALCLAVSDSVLSPPINPRSRLALPFPITTTVLEAVANYTRYKFTLADHSKTPAEIREMEGSITFDGLGSLVLKDIAVTPATLDDLITFTRAGFDGKYLLHTPGTLFGGVINGVAFASDERRLVGGALDLQWSIRTAPEYTTYLHTSREAAPVNAVVESDIYVPVGAKLVLAHLEYEVFDGKTLRWLWTPSISLMRFLPCIAAPLGGPPGGVGSTLNPPAGAGADPIPRKVRLTKVTTQTLGTGRAWGEPADKELPGGGFTYDTASWPPEVSQDGHELPSFIAVMSSGPGEPRSDGDLAHKTYTAKRIAASGDLPGMVWDDSVHASFYSRRWMDQITMEVLVHLGLHRRPTT